MSTRTIEIAPLAYMRGRTLDNCFIILDEAQNSTDLQLKMFLTRIGANAKAIITGDLTQVDLPKNQKSGLAKASRILKNVEGIGYIELDEEDVVRHKLVKSILKAYDKENQREMEIEEQEKKERKERREYYRDRDRERERYND
jgi:phosphate starvation-inducible protein PhoH and related proteins